MAVSNAGHPSNVLVMRAANSARPAVRRARTSEGLSLIEAWVWVNVVAVSPLTMYRATSARSTQAQKVAQGAIFVSAFIVVIAGAKSYTNRVLALYAVILLFAAPVFVQPHFCDCFAVALGLIGCAMLIVAYSVTNKIHLSLTVARMVALAGRRHIRIKSRRPVISRVATGPPLSRGATESRIGLNRGQERRGQDCQ